MSTGIDTLLSRSPDVCGGRIRIDGTRRCPSVVRAAAANLTSFTPAAGADYCVWLPGAASSAGEPFAYSVTAHDRDGQSATSIHLELRTPVGEHVGTLQCFFPRASSAASVAFGRWTSIAGRHLTLEVRP